MVLGIREAEQEARTERDISLAKQDAFFQYEGNVAKKKLLAEKEAELARLAAGYSSKIASLDVRTDMFVCGAFLTYLQSQMQQANIASSSPSLPSWRHVVGKRPVATCTNIVGFSIVSSCLYRTRIFII
jgi:hypothetical protein